MPPSKLKAAPKTKTLAGPAAEVPNLTAAPPKSSGVKVIAIRVADFRSLTNLEVKLDSLTVLVGPNNTGKTSLLDALQFAIGANRRFLGKEDIRLGQDEVDVPKDRKAIIDILIRPVGADGSIVETFPEGSFWTGLWGTGIAQDEQQNDMVGMRSVLEWSDVHGDYRTTRKFLKEWKSFGDWQSAEDGETVSAAHIEPIALHYIDAKRDLDDDLRTRGSFWRRLTDDLGLSDEDIERLENTLTEVNRTIVDKSKVLQHLRDNLIELRRVISFEKAGIDIAPVPRHLRDLSRGVDVSLQLGRCVGFSSYTTWHGNAEFGIALGISRLCIMATGTRPGRRRRSSHPTGAGRTGSPSPSARAEGAIRTNPRHSGAKDRHHAFALFRGAISVGGLAAFGESEV